MDFSSTAKEKTTQLSKQLQEQSGQLVDKVKSIKGKPTSPLDDGTASSEGEEPMEYMETISHTTEELIAEQEENTTAVAEAIKEAVVETNTINKKTGGIGRYKVKFYTSYSLKNRVGFFQLGFFTFHITEILSLIHLHQKSHHQIQKHYHFSIF